MRPDPKIRLPKTPNPKPRTPNSPLRPRTKTPDPRSENPDPRTQTPDPISIWHASRFPAPPRLKLLAVSDLHFSLGQFDWLVQEAPRYDAVIIAGDLLDIAGHLDLDSQIVVVAKYLRTLGSRTRLLVCSGNHDGDERDAH